MSFNIKFSSKSKYDLLEINKYISKYDKYSCTRFY